MSGEIKYTPGQAFYVVEPKNEAQRPSFFRGRPLPPISRESLNWLRLLAILTPGQSPNPVDSLEAAEEVSTMAKEVLAYLGEETE